MRSVPNWISYLHANSWIFNPFLAILINFLKSKIDLDSSIFYSKSLPNLKEFLWRKLFTFVRYSKPYFISNFWSLERPSLDQLKFEPI
jgi:hypothetical protein